MQLSFNVKNVDILGMIYTNNIINTIMETKNLIKTFKEQWLSKAECYIHTPQKIQVLIPKIQDYILKKGLKEVKESIILMSNYLRDIYSGKYKEYNKSNLLFIVAALIYLVSPIDVIPDALLAIGLTDDVAVIAFVCKEMQEELEKYKQLNKTN